MKERIFYHPNRQRTDDKPDCQKTFIKRPEVFIKRDALTGLIEKQLAGCVIDEFKLNSGLYISDYEFYCPPLEDARDIILGSKIKPMRSSVSINRPGKERFDCDDFSLLLKARFAYAAYREEEYRNFAHCFGIVWGMLPYPFPHSLNWMVTDDKTLYFVEPQTYEIFIPTDRENYRDIYFMLV